MFSRLPRAVVLAGALPTLISFGAVVGAQENRAREPAASGAHAHANGTVVGRPALLPGLGDWRHRVTTTVPRAQQFFDQGLRLAYGFNHDEAERSFSEAARLDPSCAMCWWALPTRPGPTSICR